jgi:uracil phosphoribosyltransferase
MSASLTIISHPLVQIRLTRLRDADTGHEEFRRCVHEITRLMAYEMTRNWETSPLPIRTPLTETIGTTLLHPPVLAPILRAGLGMLHGMLEMLPEARVGHIGLFRNEETKLPESYYLRAPEDLSQAKVCLLDPMLATGNSAVAAAQQLKELGARQIIFACILAAPEGIARFQAVHPDIEIYTAAVDDGLTSNAYITPGLGDAGDRYFGTV